MATTTDTSTNGRPRESCVWKFFKEEDKSVCLVSLGADRNCGHSFKGKFPTYLKTHLRKKHPSEFKDLEKMEEDKKEMRKRRPLNTTNFMKRSEAGTQLTLNDTLKSGRKYTTDSQRHKTITKHLAIFIGSTNTPIRVVENSSFQKLLGTLDPRYEMPSRHKIGKEITHTLDEIKVVIGSYLKQAMQVCKHLHRCMDKKRNELIISWNHNAFLFEKRLEKAQCHSCSSSFPFSTHCCQGCRFSSSGAR